MSFLQAATSLTPNSPSIPTSAAVAILLGYLMDQAKKLRSLPKVTYYSTYLNAYIRAATAAIGTIGISWTWSAVTGGGHQWVITIPAASVLLSGLWHWIIQYGMQHGWEIILGLTPQSKAVQAAQLTSPLKA